MKKTKPSQLQKKIRLTSETLRILSAADLRRIRGGHKDDLCCGESEDDWGCGTTPPEMF